MSQCSAGITMAHANTNNESNGGHSASPYLRRFQLPKLNTIRRNFQNDEDVDDDEWIEVQMAKNELIDIRMREIKCRLEAKNQDNVNNNSMGKNKSSTNNKTTNRCSSHTMRNSMRGDETQTSPERCPFFHPKHLFTLKNSSNGPSLAEST